MKKIVFIIAIIISGYAASAQIPTTDSARKYTDHYIRNSAIEAFTNLRLNTLLKSLANLIDTVAIGSGATINLTRTPTSTQVTITPSGGGTPAVIDSANSIRAGVMTVASWKFLDSLHRGLISLGGGTTYTAGYGISIPSTVISADTGLLSTRAWRKQGIDSLATVINTALALKQATISVSNNIRLSGTNISDKDTVSSAKTFTAVTIFSNQIGVNTSPNSKAALDISSTTLGVLFPRLTTTQMNAISSPPTGLYIFNTDTVALFKYTGSAWAKAEGTGGGGSGSPAGSNTYLQYNAAGSFGASSSLTWDNSTKTLTADSNTFTKNLITILGDPTTDMPVGINMRRNFSGGPQFTSGVGALGSTEINRWYNMDYFTISGEHHYYKSTLPAVWDALSPTGYYVQAVKAGYPNGAGQDIFTPRPAQPFNVDWVLSADGNYHTGWNQFGTQKIIWHPLNDSTNTVQQYIDANFNMTFGSNLISIKTPLIQGAIGGNYATDVASNDVASFRVTGAATTTLHENEENKDNYIKFRTKNVSSYTVSSGRVMGGFEANTIGKVYLVGSSDAPGGFTSPDLRVTLQDASGSMVEDFTVLHTGKVGINNNNPSKILDVTSTASGVLFPRMNTTQMNALTAIEGEVLYNTDSLSYCWYNGTIWQKIGTGGGSSYVLPTATSSVLGGIKIGGTLSIDGSGVVNALIPSWQTVLANSSTFTADPTQDLGTHSFKMMKGANTGHDFSYGSYQIYGNHPSIKIIDTAAGNTYYMTQSVASAEAVIGGTAADIVYQLPIITKDAASNDVANYGFNFGKMRGHIPTANTSSDPNVIFGAHGTGSFFAIFSTGSGDTRPYSLRVANNGFLALGQSSPTAQLDIAANTTSYAHVRLRPSSTVNVSSPNDGDLWYNGTNLYFRNGGTSKDLLSSTVSTFSPKDSSSTHAASTEYVDKAVYASLQTLDAVYTKTVSSTDATPFNVDTIALTGGVDEHLTINVTADAIKSGGGSYGSKKICSFYWKQSGTTLTNGTVNSITGDEYLGTGLSTATYTLTNTGNLIIIKATGEASSNITWTFKYEVTRQHF